MKILPKVAIVGEPSAGKSTFFNRLAEQRKAIVSETRGITRDRLYSKAEWLGREFTLIDTGGIVLKDAPFSKEIKVQAEIAMKESDVILFLVDGRLGITDDTLSAAKLLKKVRNKVILVVNKIDDQTLLGDAYQFYSLGFGDPFVISAIHGIGIGDLLDEVCSRFPKEKEIGSNDDKSISFAIIGRPNVGKSSLVNAMLGEERVIVSSMEGTTRDAVDTVFTREGKNFVAVDTAGLKKRGQIYESIDKYAALRAMSAVEKSDVAVVVIDADYGLTDQDQHIAGIPLEESKPMIIVINKWDLHEHGQNEQEEYKKTLIKWMPFISYVPVVFASAKNKQNIDKIFKAIEIVHEQAGKRIPTSLLNTVVRDAQLANETPLFKGGRVKINYATQSDTYPPTFVLFVNNPDFMHFSYLRYLESTFRTQFGLTNVPVKIIMRKKQTGGFKI